MRLVFQSDTADPACWRAALEAEIPGLEFRIWPDTGDPANVDMLLAYRLPPEGLDSYTQLKFVQLISAGADQLRGVEDLPAHVPVARLVEPGQVSGMIEYVVHAVLHHHRDFDLYGRQQRARLWREHPRIPAASRKVGVMGLGALGAPVARAIANLGFDVLGWSRSGNSPIDIPTWSGRAELPAFLAASEIVVAILPLTSETVGLFDDAFFSAMRPGSYFINVGRGAQLDQAALCRALRDCRIAGATLDVLVEEPPSPDDPIWDAPNLVLTPHVATSPDPVSAAAVVAENLRRVLQGKPPANPVTPG